MAINHPTLLVDAAFDVASCLIYGVVGYILARRPVSADGRLAAKLFSLWWFGLAALSLIGAMVSSAAAFDKLALPTFLAVTHLLLVLVVLILWALQYYIVYLLTGAKAWLVPLSVYYFILYAGLVYLIVGNPYTYIEVHKWSVNAGPVPQYSGLVQGLLQLTFLGPILLGALGYLSLAFRAPERTQRFRILVVSLSLLIWFGSSSIASVGGFSREDWWQFGSRFIGLGAALCILMAYVPPRWMQRRFGIQAVEQPSEGQPTESSRARPRAAGVIA